MRVAAGEKKCRRMCWKQRGRDNGRARMITGVRQSSVVGRVSQVSAALPWPGVPQAPAPAPIFHTPFWRRPELGHGRTHYSEQTLLNGFLGGPRLPCLFTWLTTMYNYYENNQTHSPGGKEKEKKRKNQKRMANCCKR